MTKFVQNLIELSLGKKMNKKLKMWHKNHDLKKKNVTKYVQNQHYIWMLPLKKVKARGIVYHEIKRSTKMQVINVK